MKFKKYISLLVAICLTVISFAKTVPVIYYDHGFMSKGIIQASLQITPKDKSIAKSVTFDISSWSITYDDLDDPIIFLWFVSTFNEPAPYAYKIDLRCWLKFYGWHRRPPPFQNSYYYGLQWDWKYVTFEGNASDQSFSGSPYYFQSGEQYGNQNELLYFGPQ